MSTQAKQHLDHLTRLWHQEQRATHDRFIAERRELTLAQRIERGHALRDLAIDDTDAAPGGRTLLWLTVRNDPSALQDLRISTGDPVRLWLDDPDSPSSVPATVARVRPDRLAVVIDGDIPDILENEGFRLDRDEPRATFERGLRALDRFKNAAAQTDEARLREVLFGDHLPEFDDPTPWTPLDPDLNDAQHQAIDNALAARDVALIHGPPGTGKTRTLVEVIRQAVLRGCRVLATAASNTAVDNLAERLASADIQVVRLGHPARVSPAMEPLTLDALLEKTDAYKLTRQWTDEANALRRRAHNRRDRNAISRSEHRDMLREAGRLSRDARNHLQQAQRQILDRAPVICATAAGADVALLAQTRFDLVVLDEATQAPDPIALVPLARASRVVLAGDPCQLPPTIIDLDAARDGLAISLFERLAARVAPHDPLAATDASPSPTSKPASSTPASTRTTRTPKSSGRLLHMLTVQHRMHRDLMAFPSRSMYHGRLTAAPSVAAHTLDDIQVLPNPLRPTPLVLIDTAGTGWDETHAADDPSTSNPAQGARTAREALRLLSRGLPPRDVAIITPYYAQARLLRDLLSPHTTVGGENGLDIGTVDGFQGREKEAILLDLVRSNPDAQIGFLSDIRRMNVAITRARRFLLIIADTATIGQHKYYAALLEAVEQHGSWISAWADDAAPIDPTDI